MFILYNTDSIDIPITLLYLPCTIPETPQ